jgi:predicted nucleotidyltransferase
MPQPRISGHVSSRRIRFKQFVEQVLGREIDLVSYGGLKAKLDDDIRREAVLL